ncbi:MAG: PadR family transcriptional regulator [Prevotellaceae bacterium]|jgi:PadR family transcriptional regulator PadR|nr:PadR family transcriptional regulator [Prevotellaceae bacterium]
MTIENTQTQMRKGILEYCILAIISRGEIYASDILGELRKAKLLVVEGTLYPLLTRLKNNGLLTYNWVESVSGPPRKYYRLSAEGAETLAQLDKTWIELVYAVESATLKNQNQN